VVKQSAATSPASLKPSASDRVFDIVNITLTSLFGILVLYPIVYVVSSSLSDPMMIVAGKVWLWPVGFTLDGYEATLSYPRVWIGFGNSIFYAVGGTAINVVLTMMAAYALARKDLVGGNIIMLIFAFTLWFRGGIIPDYLLVRSLKLLDKRLALLIFKAMDAYFLILARTYIRTQIPVELLESARIDGCNDYRFLWSIVVPLAGPIIAVITLFYAERHWNEFFHAFLFLTDRDLFPIQLVLREVLTMNMANDLMMAMGTTLAERMQYLVELLKYSLIVVASLPIVIAYPFAQRYFTKGVMIGAIKG
jgi:multiple sugar transport system permease protein/putative aldouronate transport system permease protein